MFAIASSPSTNQDSRRGRHVSAILFFNQNVECRPRKQLLEIFQHVSKGRGPQLFLTKRQLDGNAVDGITLDSAQGNKVQSRKSPSPP
jgi:hypothetical protein